MQAIPEDKITNVVNKTTFPPPLPPPPPSSTNAPLMKTAKSSSTTAAAAAAAAVPSEISPISGYGPLRLKVSHKDQGRVLIALANSHQILLQVQIDESVLKYRGVHKGKAVKAAVHKKTPASVKKVASSSGATTSAKSKGSKKVVPKTATSVKKTEPEDSQRTARTANTGKPVTTTKTTKKTATAAAAADTKTPTGRTSRSVPSPSHEIVIADKTQKDDRSTHSMPSVNTTYSDDSTRSPKDLGAAPPHPAAPLKNVSTSPRTATASKRQRTVGLSTSDASLDVEDLHSSQWDSRRQKLIQCQNKDDFADIYSETKQEITAHDKEGDDASTISTLSLSQQQRQVSTRHRRWAERQPAEHDDSFRSTRSIRSSGGVNGSDPANMTSSPTRDDSRHVSNAKSSLPSSPVKNMDSTGRTLASSSGSETFTVRNPSRSMRNTYSMKIVEPVVAVVKETKRTKKSNAAKPSNKEPASRRTKAAAAAAAGAITSDAGQLNRSRSRSHSRSKSPTKRRPGTTVGKTGGRTTATTADAANTRLKQHRHPKPHENDADDDSSTMASSRRIKAKMEKIRNVELTNRMDLPPAPPRPPTRRRPDGDTNLDDDTLSSHHSIVRELRFGKVNWVAKLRKKLRATRKDKYMID